MITCIPHSCDTVTLKTNSMNNQDKTCTNLREVDTAAFIENLIFNRLHNFYKEQFGFHL